MEAAGISHNQRTHMAGMQHRPLPLFGCHHDAAVFRESHKHDFEADNFVGIHRCLDTGTWSMLLEDKNKLVSTWACPNAQLYKK